VAESYDRRASDHHRVKTIVLIDEIVLTPG
jgi:hypothetical protein